MTTAAFLIACGLCVLSGFGIGYLCGRDTGEEEGRDRQWMDDFFLSVETQRKREQSRTERTKRKD